MDSLEPYGLLEKLFPFPHDNNCKALSLMLGCSFGP